jgi:hypothetical protein
MKVTTPRKQLRIFFCSAGIFKQSVGARNRVRIQKRVVVQARQATQPGGIGSLESILGLLQSLKLGAQRRKFMPKHFPAGQF